MVMQLTCTTCGSVIPGDGDHLHIPVPVWVENQYATLTRMWNTVIDTETHNTPIIHGDLDRLECRIKNIGGAIIYVASTPIIAVGDAGWIVLPGEEYREFRYRGDLFAIGQVANTPITVIEYYKRENP